MSEKKRKRQSQGSSAPNKKVASDTTPLKVDYRDDSALHPVLVASSGLSKPAIPFQAYARSRSSKHDKATPTPSTHDVLLYSSAHPTLDYTAPPAADNNHLSHYIAIHNPSLNTLQVVPAHYASLQCTLRSEQEEVERDNARQTAAQQREQLGMEFGTKKAKKAIASKTENAIMREADGASGKKDGVQSAILEGMASNTRAENIEQTLAQQLATKPIPKPNLNAESADAVYSLSTLVPPSDLRLVDHEDWQEKARNNEEIKLNFRFPAYRVSQIGQGDDVTKLKALRYLSLLLDFHAILSGGGKSGKRVPRKDVLAQKLQGYPDQLVDSVRRRFSENNELSKFHVDNLITHMAALTLYIDNWTTNTSNLKDDLRFDNKTMSQYFNELGCKVAPPTEKERERAGITKAAANATRFAKLKLPLEFPKPRTGRRR